MYLHKINFKWHVKTNMNQMLNFNFYMLVVYNVDNKQQKDVYKSDVIMMHIIFHSASLNTLTWLVKDVKLASSQ